MNGKLILAAKYSFLAFAAFIVPKLIVDSGRLVAPLEPRKSNGDAIETAQNVGERSFWPFVEFSQPPVPDAAPDFAGRERAFGGSSGSDALNPASETARFGAFNDRFNNRFGTRIGGDGGESGNFGASATGAYYHSANYPNFSNFDGSSNYANAANGAFPATFADRRRDASLFAPETVATSNPFLAETASENAAFAPTPKKSLGELFRFGRSPAWFVENWARVDAAPSEDGLLGYRVAVSTGDEIDDLTGVLTCYFDSTSDRRVVFSGQTGDYRKTLRFLEREFGVELSPTSTAARLEYVSTLKTSGNAPPSRIVVRPTRVFLRGAEKSFFNIDVVLERPYN